MAAKLVSLGGKSGMKNVEPLLQSGLICPLLTAKQTSVIETPEFVCSGDSSNLVIPRDRSPSKTA